MKGGELRVVLISLMKTMAENVRRWAFFPSLKWDDAETTINDNCDFINMQYSWG